jgi:hypothetical protein
VIGIAIAFAVLLSIVLTLVPGSDTEAVGEEPKVTLNFAEVTTKFAVPAGERVRARAVCDSGYAVTGMAWATYTSSGDAPTYPPSLKVVTKVSKNQRAGVFIAFYPEKFFDVFTEISVEGTVTCLLLPAVQ